MSKAGTAILWLIIGLIIGWAATYYTVRCQSSTVGISVQGSGTPGDGSIQITTTGKKNQNN